MGLLNLGIGLSDMGNSIAQSAGNMALQQQKENLEKDNLLLADKLTTAREYNAPGVAEEVASKRLANKEALLNYQYLYDTDDDPTKDPAGGPGAPTGTGSPAATGTDATSKPHFREIPKDLLPPSMTIESARYLQRTDPKALQAIIQDWKKPRDTRTGNTVNYTDPQTGEQVILYRNEADVKPFTDEDRAKFGLTKEDKGYMENGAPKLLRGPGAPVKVYNKDGKVVYSTAQDSIGQQAPPDANTPLPTTPEQDESAAAQAATGQPLTAIFPGYRGAAVNQREKARQGAIKLIMDQMGISAPEAGEELANRTIEYQAGKRSVGQLTTMLGGTKQAVDQLEFNIQKSKEEMAKLPSTNLAPVFNALMRVEEKWTGDPTYFTLYFYMHTAQMEAARLQAGAQATVAQLNVEAAKEAKNWADMGMTPKSWDAVSDAIHQEGQNRIQTFEGAIKRQRSSAGLTPTPGATPPPGNVQPTGAAPPPAGNVTTTPVIDNILNKYPPKGK